MVSSRSIPACAGKPTAGTSSTKASRVHPRVCGEAPANTALWPALGGPSPRVRGSPKRPDALGYFHRSIPACAGKPADESRAERRLRVHPRVCGEAHRHVTWRDNAWGPSPRVRGSRNNGICREPGAGSIPACAGKPWRGASRRDWLRVHPRVCGEACVPLAERCTEKGPSPRVRGSHEEPSVRCIESGSIPACAGKPLKASRSVRRSRVHPRVCGEAARVSRKPPAPLGPSPRVRGSLYPALATASALGSIPACAGKPRRPPAWS